MGKKLSSRLFDEKKPMINIKRQKLLVKYDVTISTEKKKLNTLNIKIRVGVRLLDVPTAQKLSMGGGG